MKRRIFCSLIAAVTAVVLSACRGEDTVYLESDTQEELEEIKEELNSEGSACQPASCYVYICGRVNSPGVYELQEDARVCDVIALAGGLCEDAAEELNQAEKITDGQMIRVYSVDEAAEQQPQEEADDRVNINTASEEELMTLPGIGASKAQSIIDYRNEQGTIKDINELMNIPGIKTGVFTKIKDSIRVN